MRFWIDASVVVAVRVTRAMSLLFEQGWAVNELARGRAIALGEACEPLSEHHS